MKQIERISTVFFIILFLLSFSFVHADSVSQKTVTVSPSEIRLSGLAGTPLRTVVQIIPEIKCSFNINKVYAESGKDIQYRLKTVSDPERKNRYLLFIENLKQTSGQYVDLIHIVTDSDIQPEIDIPVYGNIIKKDDDISVANAAEKHECPDALKERFPLTGKCAFEERVNIINIRFDSGSSKTSSSQALAQIAGALKSEGLKNARILIQGHTDNIGSSESNLALSFARAKSVMNLLVNLYGVDKERLSADGLGEAMPVTSNATPSGRALNRRIEFVYLGDLKK